MKTKNNLAFNVAASVALLIVLFVVVALVVGAQMVCQRYIGPFMTNSNDPVAIALYCKPR